MQENRQISIMRFLNRLVTQLVHILFLVLLINFKPDVGSGWALKSAPSSSNNKLDEAAGCHLRELELCAVGVMSIFQNPNGLPSTSQELKRQCDYFDESTQCFSSYSDRCLTKFQMPVVELFTSDLMQLGQEFCNTSSEFRANYTKHVACLREVQRKHQRPCLTDLQVGFEPIHKLNVSTKMSTGCCNINRLKECILSKIEADCGASAVDMVGLMIERLTGNVVSIVCREYDPFGETCLGLLPKVDTKPFNGRNTSALSRIISGLTNGPAQK